MNPYEKSQDLSPSILPAKSESLHQCEMKNKVERFSSMQMLGTRPDVYKKKFQYRFEMNWIIFRTHLDTCRGIFGLPGENNNESWHKTDCCNVLSRGPFYHKSRSSTLFIAGASTCFITPSFSYTKISVRISPVCGFNSNEKFCLKSLEKWTEGKKHLFGILWLKWNFNLHIQILHGSFSWN